MDWNAAIEKNREALKRVLAALFAMAGLAGDRRADRRVTLPRHLHRAVLRLLRPAEAAARRLIIVAARGIVVALSPVRSRRLAANIPGGCDGKTTRQPGFPLFDPLPRWPVRRRSTAGVPRISFPGFLPPFPVPDRRPPTPYDGVDASCLSQRMAALSSVLDDLPRHAKRFARWRARVAIAARNQHQGADAPDRKRRIARSRRQWPLRPGRPPGASRRPAHEVHELLDTTHGLAIWAMEPRDTS